MFESIHGTPQFEAILAKLETLGDVRSNTRNVRTTCPMHDGDSPDSFVLFPSGVGHCFSSCRRSFSPRELAERLEVNLPGTNGLTAEEFLTAFGLPDWIQTEFGLKTSTYKDRNWVTIPFLDERGELLRNRKRLRLHDGQKHEWQGSGGRTYPFGLQRLKEIRQLGKCLIVEGETDVLASAAGGVPAIGLPGASTWKEEYRKYFKGVEVAIWQEPGDAGRGFVDSIGQDLPDAKILKHETVKDLAELWLLFDDEQFGKEIERLWGSAKIFSELLSAHKEQERDELRPRVKPLLTSDDLIDRICTAIKGTGFVGDIRPALVGYITLTSRMSSKPSNLKYLGEPSSGKNACIDAVLPLFPETAYVEIDAASPSVLIYGDFDLKYRGLILKEIDSMPRSDSNHASFFRTLMDKGRATFRVTTDGKPGEPRQVIEKVVEGPVAFITTGIRDLASQEHSRMLTQPIDDSPERVRAVSKMQAKRRSGQLEVPDQSAFVDLQRYLELGGPYRVIVPYWDALVDAMPAVLFQSVRQNRDADQLLAVIESLAILHQEQRDKDGKGRIVAVIDDYIHARWILNSLFEVAAGGGVTAQDREAYGAVSLLQLQHPEGVKNADIAKYLGRASNTISYRMKRLHSKGLVTNASSKRNEYAWKIGSQLPDNSGLPTPEEVIEFFATSPADNSSNIRTQPLAESSENSDFEGSNGNPRASDEESDHYDWEAI